MKVGTDAVILGVWTKTNGVKSVLDIGTGCGILPLMLAQKSSAKILGIDIHKDSVIQANENFTMSPWSENLCAKNISLQDFYSKTEQRFDLIVSNPPFFRNSIKPGNPARSFARHDDALSQHDLLSNASGLLNKNGQFNVVLPAAEEKIFISKAMIFDLNIQKKLFFIPREGKKCNRVLLSFISGSVPENVIEKTITMRDSDGEHSEAFINFTKDYYLFDPAIIQQRLVDFEKKHINH